MNKIFVIHYNKLVKRKENILRYFDEKDVLFVDMYDRDTLTEKQLKHFDLKLYSVATFLSHIYCLYYIVKNNLEYGIIIEDDFIPNDNFWNNYNKKLNIVDDDYILFFSNEKKNDKKEIENIKKISRFSGHGQSRYASGYYITNKVCDDILEMFDRYINSELKIKHQIDFWYNIVLNYKNSNVYWTMESWGEEGSKNGEYDTTMSNLVSPTNF
jgi:GR25 family glycosyltransferase involved in LPS biosynthesis